MTVRRNGRSIPTLVPTIWFQRVPLRPNASHRPDRPLPMSSKNGTLRDRPRYRGIFPISLIMLRLLVRFQLAPLVNTQFRGPRATTISPTPRTAGSGVGAQFSFGLGVDA